MRIGSTHGYARIGYAGVFLALALPALNAQEQGAGLAGSVVDSWEIAVADADLSLTNSQTAAELKAKVNQAGEYSFSKISPGKYDLTASAKGFKPYSRHALEFKVQPQGEALRLDVRMDREKDDAGPTIKELETKVASKRDDYVAHFDLARAYFTKGDLDNAARQFQETLKLKPDFRSAKLALARTALRVGMAASALPFAVDLINAKPGDVAATLIAATAYLRIRQPDEASDELDKLLKTNPFDTDVLIESGVINVQRKHYPEAETSFRRAYALDPSNVRGLVDAADVHFVKKEPDKAVQMIAAEVEKFPDRADLRKELGIMEMRAKEFDKAIADFTSVLDKFHDRPKEQADVYEGIGQSYQGKGDLTRAIDATKKATQMSPDDAGFFSSLASMYDAAGKPKDALEAYRQALKIDPTNAYIMNNAAYSIARSGGDMDDALRLVQMARRQLPNVDAVNDTLGWIYLKMDLVDSACQVYQDLVEKANTVSTFHYHYALALEKKGDKAAALEQLDAALKNTPEKDEEVQIKELIKKLS